MKDFLSHTFKGIFEGESIKETSWGSWYLKVLWALQNGRQVEPKFEGYEVEVDGLLRYQGRMYVP